MLKTAKSRHSAGFTLVEMMVAMMLTSIVIFGSYLMFTSSSESFNHQELNAQNNNNLRFAVELLKADLSRAGYHASPNAMRDPFICPKPTFPVPGVMVFENKTLTESGYPALTFDELLIVGEMSSLSPFPVRTLASTSIQLQPADDYAGLTATQKTIRDTKFENAFRPHSIVRVLNPDGVAQFAEVGSSSGGTHSISLLTSLAQASDEASCGYMPMAAENHEVNPVVAYLYTIEIDPNEAEKTDLVRWEVNYSGGTTPTPIPGTRLVVAEYIVGIRFMALGPPAAATPQETTVALENVEDLISLDASTSTSASVIKNIGNRPQSARFMVYRLESRTRRALPRRLVMPSEVINADTAERGYIELEGQRVAEVRTIQGKIGLPNHILRNLN